MYNNIGRSIKTLAKVIAFIGVAISVIWGIIVASPSGNLSQVSNDLANTIILTGLLIGLLGSILSIVLSFFMYGFGQLIESTQNIEKKVVFEKTIEQIKREEYPELSDATYYSIVNSDKKVKSKYCENCGSRLAKNAGVCDFCGEKTEE